MYEYHMKKQEEKEKYNLAVSIQDKTLNFLKEASLEDLRCMKHFMDNFRNYRGLINLLREKNDSR